MQIILIILLVPNLDKGVDCHDGHVWLRLGVVHQVQVHQLLQFLVVRLHAVDHIGEQRRNVLAHRHAGNHLLEENIKIYNRFYNIAINCGKKNENL